MVKGIKAFCDGTLSIQNSNYREVAKVKINDLFPIINILDFDATALMFNILQQRQFLYTIYELVSSIT